MGAINKRLITRYKSLQWGVQIDHHMTRDVANLMSVWRLRIPAGNDYLWDGPSDKIQPHLSEFNFSEVPFKLLANPDNL